MYCIAGVTFCAEAPLPRAPIMNARDGPHRGKRTGKWRGTQHSWPRVQTRAGAELLRTKPLPHAPSRAPDITLTMP